MIAETREQAEENERKWAIRRPGTTEIVDQPEINVNVVGDEDDDVIVDCNDIGITEANLNPVEMIFLDIMKFHIYRLERHECLPKFIPGENGMPLSTDIEFWYYHFPDTFHWPKSYTYSYSTSWVNSVKKFKQANPFEFDDILAYLTECSNDWREERIPGCWEKFRVKDHYMPEENILLYIEVYYIGRFRDPLTQWAAAPEFCPK